MNTLPIHMSMGMSNMRAVCCRLLLLFMWMIAIAIAVGVLPHHA
jgi:hypothetical protein